MLLNVKPFINHIYREDTAQEVGRPDGYTLTEHHGSRDAQMSKGDFGRKNVLEERNERAVGIEDLEKGDLIFLYWGDASEIRGQLPKRDVQYDTPIKVVGFYLGVRGRKRKHLIIAKEKLPAKDYWNADFIPVELIDHIILLCPRALQHVEPQLLKEIRKVIRGGSSRFTHKVKVIRI